MSFLNNQGQSDPVFKKPSGFPSRSRKTFNNTQSSCNSCKSEGVGNHQTLVQQVGERLVVLEKICQDRPENLTRILTDTIDHLNAACYSQLAEKLLSPSNTQVSSFGGSECSTRSSVLTAPFNYAPSIASNQEFPFESTRRRNNTATSGNRYGLLNSAIPENRPLNFLTEQFSRVNNAYYEPEPPARTVTKKPVRSKKNIASTTDHVEKQDLAPGLSIPFRIEKPNPPAAPPKPPLRKQLSETKELEVLPSEDDDSLSQFFGRRRNVKQTTTAPSKQNDQYEKPTTSRDLSITLQRTELVKEKESAAAADALRKRKASQTDEDPSKKKAPVVEKRPSPDTTMPNSSAKERAEAANNNTLRRSNRNASILSTRNPERVTKSKENKENKTKARTTTKKPKSQKEAKNANAKTASRADKGAKRAAVDEDAASNKNDEAEMFDEDSFFGDVSSIVGSSSLVLTNTIAKNVTKHSAVSQTDGQSHFFSPFVNVRSTSGVSAISTPLSKTLTKNVLGKRVKKPNAVAEFKNAQSRKPRRANAPATDVAPLPEHSAESSESESAVELECSDFRGF